MTPDEKRIIDAHLQLAVTEIGECLADLGRVLAQNAREDNAALRGGIAAGLEKAAKRIRGDFAILQASTDANGTDTPPGLPLRARDHGEG